MWLLNDGPTVQSQISYMEPTIDRICDTETSPIGYHRRNEPNTWPIQIYHYFYWA
jgi:hypothetical protein